MANNSKMTLRMLPSYRQIDFNIGEYIWYICFYYFQFALLLWIWIIWPLNPWFVTLTTVVWGWTAVYEWTWSGGRWGHVSTLTPAHISWPFPWRDLLLKWIYLIMFLVSWYMYQHLVMPFLPQCKIVHVKINTELLFV
jgi:hypothetical protein